MEEEEDGSKQQIGPSYEEFLKQSERAVYISINLTFPLPHLRIKSNLTEKLLLHKIFS